MFNTVLGPWRVSEPARQCCVWSPQVSSKLTAVVFLECDSGVEVCNVISRRYDTRTKETCAHHFDK